jgi:signal transduction histidine kinase
LFANAGFDGTLRRAVLDADGRLPQALLRRAAGVPGGLRQTHRIAEADGTPHLFEGRHQAVPGADGAPAAIVGAFHEVTRAREAMESVRALRGRYEEILSTVSDWVWQLDCDWRFTASSTRGNEVLGFDPGFVVGRDFFEVGQVQANPKVARERPLKRTRRAPFDQVLYRLTTGDTGERLFELSAIPKFDEETGAFAGFQGSARNVTQEVQADRRARDYRGELEAALDELRDKNAELDAALTRAQAADRAKNEFLAMVGHELRTPLNAVIGFSEIMDQQIFGALGDERYDAYVDDILGSSRHLLGVINDIIDVVKLELREVTLRPDGIAVARLLDTCAAFVREKARKDGLDLEVQAPDGLPELVADPQKVRQMLINLLTNAVKFTEQGGRVRLAAEAAGDEIRFVVADTGVGMAPEEIETVLQPFKQADGSLARTHEGLGLGLPLSARLAEAHGGRLAVESEPGAGTTVTINLPLRPPEDA